MLDLILHIDRQLDGMIHSLGTGVYGVLFLIVFAETGLVVVPFLPGDSLLFAAGTLAARDGSPLNIVVMMGVLILAALCGDNTNYFVGKTLGPRLFRNENSKLFKKAHLTHTHAFFEKHGGKTIILARFVPIVRTFAPFVAGLGAMTYPRFLAFSVVSACLWVGLCTMLGYTFGQLPLIQKNFHIAVVAIILISLVPMLVEILRHRRQAADVSPDATLP